MNGCFIANAIFTIFKAGKLRNVTSRDKRLATSTSKDSHPNIGILGKVLANRLKAFIQSNRHGIECCHVIKANVGNLATQCKAYLRNLTLLIFWCHRKNYSALMFRLLTKRWYLASSPVKNRLNAAGVAGPSGCKPCESNVFLICGSAIAALTA